MSAFGPAAPRPRRILTIADRRVVDAIVDGVAAQVSGTYAQPFVPEEAGKAGWQELLEGTSPTAGTDYTYKVPGDRVLFPLSVMCRLQTSAVAGNRSLTLEYRDGYGVRFLVAGAPVTLTALGSQAFCWQPVAGANQWPVNDAAIAPLPQQHLYPTQQLVLHLAGGDAGDAIDRVRISGWFWRTNRS